MAFRIAHISDTHLGGAKGYFIDNFRRVGAAVKASHPDVVINTGDISFDGANDEPDLATARRLHDDLGLPVRTIPGNHDLGESVEAISKEPRIDAARRERFVRHFGPDWWCFDVPGWRVLGIDAMLVGSGLAAEAEQGTAIAQAVRGRGDRKLALFLHKPLFDRAADETEIGWRFMNPVPRHQLIDALQDATLALVASGHIHQYRSTRVDGVHHVWAPSTGFILPDSRQPRYGLKETGYVEHRLMPDGTAESVLVRVPGLPTLDIADFPDAYGH
jgi:3',5'-cyclic AMP phosphodiesterase CpdA